MLDKITHTDELTHTSVMFDEITHTSAMFDEITMSLV
jgi:hypothetical protein